MLSPRARNRAALARQHLLARADLPALDLVQRLVGLQAVDPAVAAWSRLRDVGPGVLPAALADREAVVLPLMRGQRYVVTAADALALWPVLRAYRWSGWLEHRESRTVPTEICRRMFRATRAFLRDGARRMAELSAHLAQRWPEYERWVPGYVAAYGLPLVEVPPAHPEGPGVQLLDVWLGQEPGRDDRPDPLLRRYLAASGPASAAQIARWSGVTDADAALERLRPELRTFRDEDGTELFDVPDGLLPDPETPAPPRLIPDADDVLSLPVDGPGGPRGAEFLAGRTGFLLVDGFVAGRWQVDDRQRLQRLVVDVTVRLTRAQRIDLLLEAERLLPFLLPDAAHRNVTFDLARPLH